MARSSKIWFTPAGAGRGQAPSGHGGRRAITRDLHDQERQSELELLAPVAHQRCEQRVVARRALDVGLTLIPEHAA